VYLCHLYIVIYVLSYFYLYSKSLIGRKCTFKLVIDGTSLVFAVLMLVSNNILSFKCEIFYKKLPNLKKPYCFVRDYPGVVCTDGAILFCTFCETNVSYN